MNMVQNNCKSEGLNSIQNLLPSLKFSNILEKFNSLGNFVYNHNLYDYNIANISQNDSNLMNFFQNNPIIQNAANPSLINIKRERTSSSLDKDVDLKKSSSSSNNDDNDNDKDEIKQEEEDNYNHQLNKLKNNSSSLDESKN